MAPQTSADRFHPTWRTALMVPLFVALMTAMLAAPAHAAPVPVQAERADTSNVQAAPWDGWLMENVNSRTCLQNPEGDFVRLNFCDANDSRQAWFWHEGSIVNLATGNCLDSNRAGDVYAIKCNFGMNQQWTKDGNQRINKQTGKCLNRSNGTYAVHAGQCGVWSQWRSR